MIIKAKSRTKGMNAASPGSRRAARDTTPRQAAESAPRPAHHLPPAKLPKPRIIAADKDHPESRVYIGDCRAILPAIPECARHEVDLIYADPPFNWARDYDRHKHESPAYKTWHDALPDDEYMRFTMDWLTACVDALSPKGTLFVNIPDDWAAEIVVFLKHTLHLHMVNWCIWHYRFGQNTNGRFINSKVHVLYFCKDPAKRTWNEVPILEPSDRATTYADPRTFNKKEGTSGMRVPMDVWYGKHWGRIQGNNKERRPRHDNQIPEVYMERVIRACSNEGDLVLDPFLGSGTSCTVARELRRRSIGIEYSSANATSAIERIRKGPLRVRFDTPTIHINPIFAARSTILKPDQSDAGADSE